MDFRDAVYQARSRLAEYIDITTVAMKDDPGAEIFYLSRLAQAAEMSSLLHAALNIERLQAIVRKENMTFDADILRSESGRGVRGAFNRLSRSVGELENCSHIEGGSQSGPGGLAGERLSSVTFVWDYIQLDFDGQGFDVCCPILINGPKGPVATGEAEFKNRLCDLIGRSVDRVSVGEHSVDLWMGADTLSLDYACGEACIPEPLAFTNWDGHIQIFSRD